MLLERDKSQLLMVDVQERLLPAMSDPTLVLKNGGRLLEAARTLAVPVVVSEQYPAGLGRTVPELANLAPANAVHEKVEFSCFANSALHAALSAPDRQTVIFGIEAHVCVLQTAIEMAAAGTTLPSSSTPSARALPRARRSRCAACRMPASGWRPPRWCCSSGCAAPARRNSRRSAA